MNIIGWYNNKDNKKIKNCNYNNKWIKQRESSNIGDKSYKIINKDSQVEVGGLGWEEKVFLVKSIMHKIKLIDYQIKSFNFSIK